MLLKFTDCIKGRVRKIKNISWMLRGLLGFLRLFIKNFENLLEEKILELNW